MQPKATMTLTARLLEATSDWERHTFHGQCIKTIKSSSGSIYAGSRDAHVALLRALFTVIRRSRPGAENNAGRKFGARFAKPITCWLRQKRVSIAADSYHRVLRTRADKAPENSSRVRQILSEPRGAVGTLVQLIRSIS